MTTVQPVDDTDLELVEALDFDPPCECTTFGIECGFPASWFMVMRRHCRDGSQADAGTVSVLACQEHYEAVLKGAPGICGSCLSLYPDLLRYVIRTERLKP